MTTRQRVAVVTAAVLCAAVALTVLAGTDAPRHPAGWGTSVVLAALLAWSGRLQVHVRHRGGSEASDLFDVSLAVCAVAFPAPVLLVVALGAKAASQWAERVEGHKASFNVATAGASAGAMALVLQVLQDRPLLLALALAQLAGWLANHAALLAVLSAAGLRREIVTASATRRWAVQGVVSGVLGILLTLAWVQSPLAVVLFVVPLAALHHAGRALSSAAAERRRLAGTAAASRVLSSGSAADLPAYLEHLRAAFGAQAAHLRTDPEVGPPLTVGAPLGAPVRRWLADLDAALPDEEAQRLHVDLPERVEVLAVRLPDSRSGVLAVIDPRGERDSGSAELATAAAAAREVSSFLDAQRARGLAAQEHDRLEAVIRSVADGIVTVAADGRLLSFNSAAAEITGLCPVQALQCSVDLLQLSTTEGEVWDPLEHLRVRLSGVRLQLRTSQGLPRHVDVSSSPAVVDGQDCAVLVLRDVTARVEQERARQRFVIGLGHELRTPLTPLLGWARTLRRRPELLDGRRRGDEVDALDTESARLARLVDNLLTAVDPSSLLGQRTAVDLADLVQAQVRHARPQLSGRTVTVVTQGATRITTNARAVAQILDNLLSNVARYTPPASCVRIGVGVEDAVAVVEVVDEGPGVAESQREEIFGLFVRGEGEAANPGAGMGLAVSRSLARSLGGDLVCVAPPAGESGQEAPGAAFRLLLPVHVAPRQSQPEVVSQLFAV